MLPSSKKETSHTGLVIIAFHPSNKTPAGSGLITAFCPLASLRESWKQPGVLENRWWPPHSLTGLLSTFPAPFGHVLKPSLLRGDKKG